MKTFGFFLILSLSVIGCSDGHHKIYQYDKIYHTESIDSFKMSHFKDKVSDNILYLNDDSRFLKSDLEDLCDRNKVNCFIQDMNFDSKDLNAELDSALAGLNSFKGSVLLVSSNRDSAALFVGTYAHRIKKASEKTLTQIASDLGADEKNISKITEMAQKASQKDN